MQTPRGLINIQPALIAIIIYIRFGLISIIKTNNGLDAEKFTFGTD